MKIIVYIFDYVLNKYYCVNFRISFSPVCDETACRKFTFDAPLRVAFCLTRKLLWHRALLRYRLFDTPFKLHFVHPSRFYSRFCAFVCTRQNIYNCVACYWNKIIPPTQLILSKSPSWFGIMNFHWKQKLGVSFVCKCKCIKCHELIASHLSRTKKFWECQKHEGGRGIYVLTKAHARKWKRSHRVKQ